MPPLLQSAQLKPDVTITSADDNSDIDDSDDDRYEICLFCFLGLIFFCSSLFLSCSHRHKLTSPDYINHNGP